MEGNDSNPLNTGDRTLPINPAALYDQIHLRLERAQLLENSVNELPSEAAHCAALLIGKNATTRDDVLRRTELPAAAVRHELDAIQRGYIAKARHDQKRWAA